PGMTMTSRASESSPCKGAPVRLKARARPAHSAAQTACQAHRPGRSAARAVRAVWAWAGAGLTTFRVSKGGPTRGPRDSARAAREPSFADRPLASALPPQAIISRWTVADWLGISVETDL